MEAAPLNLAHTHARNASLETKRSNPVAASEEHDLAAAEFATAAQSSSDEEAIRILNLLEQHHKKLGQILRSAHEKPAAEEHNEFTNPETLKTTGNANKPPRLSRTPRESTRELSSSIASNLATARGIPPTRQKRPTPASPLVSNQHAPGHVSHDSTQPTAATQAQSSSRPSWAPPAMSAVEDKAEPSAGADSPFQLFYNTFEGLISKMSAPLAFAGLPLAQVPEEKPPATLKKTSQPSRPDKKDSPMDYSRLISSAAFRAVSTNPTTLTPSKRIEDSFYHVPTAGGTVSYAEMVNRADREAARTFGHHHHRQGSNLSNISEDDFVDASSTILAQQQSKSPRVGRRGPGTTDPTVDGKTMEELALENATLKHISDTLSRRLHVFEMSSQTSTAALAQSIRSMPRSPEQSRGGASSSSKKHPQPTSGNTGGREGGPAADERTSKRIAELEDILRKSDARVRKRDAENERLRETIGKYKEKWDSLKAGAKARRERQQGEASSGGGRVGLGRRDSENTIIGTAIAEED